ncbi:hypothetical protein LEN26_011893 [Aphanomyces euteiches]|nr:hypothetical protein LEN26_011893 [Aphanomyces euteiches]
MGNKFGQSGGHKSDVNHVTNKRKAASVESNNGESFYCGGTQNHLTNGKSHFKKQCPLRKELFANNDFRKHMNDKKAKKARKDVKGDMIQSIDRGSGYRESSGEVQPSVESELDFFNLNPMDDVDSSGYMDMGDASAVDVNQVDSSVISKRLKNLSIKAKHVNSNVDSEVQRNYPFLLTDRELCTSDWALHSGCGRHLTGKADYFSSKTNEDNLVFRFGEGSKLTIRTLEKCNSGFVQRMEYHRIDSTLSCWFQEQSRTS